MPTKTKRAKREDRHIVQVLVMDKFCRSGNCPDVYENKKEAERAIAQKGISYMTYRVRKLTRREAGQGRRGR